MRNYLFGIITLFLLNGCSQKHQINIGDITLQERTAMPNKVQEHYMSFTQEYYDNKLYPVSEYCDDKRDYLSDDKFSTETYLKITNERTKQNRVGKYPIWFLLNDDASDIRCVKKSANFINEEPFVVSDTDNLSVKLLQKNEAEKGVPIAELSVLIDFVSLVVPQTANFLLRTNNIIKDPLTQNYLNMMDNAFKHGDLDGTKSRDFKTNIAVIKVKLNVPEEDNVLRELGYILLKPKYRTTLTTVDIINDIPNFRFIYNSSDPRIEDIMHYQLKHKNMTVKTVVDNFMQVSNEHLIEALSSLNTQLMNRFTRYDRALILSIALRQSDLYKHLAQSINIKDVAKVKTYMSVLNNEQNPLHDLNKELQATGCDYYGLMYQAQELIKNTDALAREEATEAERLKEEQLRYQIALQGIENFLRPVSNWNYIPRMFIENAEISKTNGETVSFSQLETMYNRENNVSAYGCYVDLQSKIHGESVQDYLIHPNYSNGTKYNYMALSVNKQNKIDIIFYKLTSGNNLKIEKILIDQNNQFIMKKRVNEVLKTKSAQSCSNSIIRLF
ncbi:hypothetical protein KKC13_10350 [bacterium]|nr:hypothetical protein [bacterium]MBU1957415.1 hypothetical protein [bacterium]